MPQICLPLLNARSARLNFSLLVLAMGALLLPSQGHAQCSVNGNVTTCTSSGGITFSASDFTSVGSSITVSGVSGTVTNISITLNNFAPDNENDATSLAMALVQPNTGTALDLMSGACGATSTSFTLNDTGDTGTDQVDGMLPFSGSGATCASSGFSGTYYPSDWFPGGDTFNSPGPSSYLSGGNAGFDGSGTDNFSSAYRLPSSSNINGTWTLYVANQSSPAATGSLGSWSISFTTEMATSTTTSLAASPNGGSSLVYTSKNVHGDSTTPTTVTLTATVSPAPDSGTVTFYDSTGTNPGQGTVLASSIPVSSGVAQTTVTFATEGPRSISAVYSGDSSYATSTSTDATVLTTNHPYNPSGATFCNGPITINNNPSESSSGGASTPYASLMALGTGFSQLSGTIESVSVSLNGISLQNDTDLYDLGLMLQAPGSNTTGLGSSGNAFEFLSQAGNPYQSGSLTIADTGSAEIPYDAAPSCSNCLPTDNWVDVGSSNLDTYPSPAPGSFDKAAPTGSSTFATEFGGQGANNTWSLYVDDRISLPTPLGTIGEWCLNFTMQANANPTTTSVTASPNPATFSSGTTAPVTLTATVTSTGGTVNAGTVTFDDGSTEVGSAPVVNGTASVSSIQLSEGTHQITASYSGTNTGTVFGISSGKFDQRVNKATVAPSGTGPTYSYCNTGSITAPGLGEDSGAAYPYPSNIFVTNLPGTVKTTTITLNGFNAKDQGDLMSLLVGPSSNSNRWNNNFDFFSLTGSSVSVPSTSNLTFADGGANIGGSNLENSGTYAPESNDTLTFPQCGQNASDCGTENIGPPLGTGSTFTPTNKAAPEGTGTFASIFTGSTYVGDGTWSLYLDDGGPLGGGETTNVTNGWCVNLTENPVSVTAETNHSGDFTQGQSNAQFTVDITNNGTGPTGDPSQGSNPLKVVDNLNPNNLATSPMTFAGTYSGTGWACSGTTTVTCTNESSITDQSPNNTYPQLTIDVNVDANAPASLSNSVSVSGAGVTPTTSNTDIITVLVSTTTTASNASTNFSESAQSVTLNATVAGNATTVNSGTVTFAVYEGATLIGVPVTSGTVTSGAASANFTLPAGTSAGTYTIDATYNGSATFATSSDNTHTLTVNQAATSVSVTPTTTSFSATDQLVSLSATVSSGAGAVNEGTVTFTVFNGGTPVGSATTSGTVSNGAASVNYTLPGGTTGGTYTITATYSGGVDFSGSTNNGTLTVDQPPTITSGNSASFQVGAAGTFTVTSSGYPLPAFSVTSGTLPSGVTLTDNGNGTATLSGTPAFNTAGSYPITIQASNGIGSPYAQSFTLTVTPASILVVDSNGDDSGIAGNCAVQTSPTTNTGNNSCSLRDALAESQALGAASIYFYPGTFTLATTINETNGVLAIPASTAIIGLTSGTGTSLTNLVTVSGATSSVFSVASGLSASLANLNVTGGNAAPGNGGGINNLGTLTVMGSAFYGNSGFSGGGIFNDGTLTVSSSAFYGNTASGGNGGGIANYLNGTLTVTNSSFYNNSTASGSGGGISNIGSGAVTVTDSTISGNSASNGSGGGVSSGGSTFTIANSIVAGNTAGSDVDAVGTFTDGGNNLIGDGTGVIGITNGANGDQVGTTASPIQAALAAMGNYGGPTETMLPLPNSPAVCAGSYAAAQSAGLSADQRGVTFGNTGAGGYCSAGAIDIGAAQTAYALNFSGEPANPQYSSVPFSVAVTLTESGLPFTAQPETIQLALQNGTVASFTGNSAVTGTVSPNAGVANFSLTAINPTAVTGLQLGATLSAGLATPATSTSFDLDEPPPSVLTSPSPSSTLTGPKVTFTWSTANGATDYSFRLGTARGSANLYASGPTTATSVTLTNLPINGQTIYGQLCTHFGSTPNCTNYTFTAASPGALTTPTPSSTLTGAQVTFTWNAGGGVTNYSFRLGTTPGGNDLYGSGAITGTSVTAYLPTNGETIYARLYSNFSTGGTYTDYVYTAATLGGLISPAPSSVLTGPKVTFTWSSASGATGYNLRLGTTLGSANLYGSGLTTATSVTVFNLPINGQTIYGQLCTHYGSPQTCANYTFTAASPGALSTPAPNSVLTGSTVTFTWNAGGGVANYSLRLGTTPGGNDLYGSGPVTGTSVTASNLPTNGETIYARLYSNFSSGGTYTDYVFTAAP